MPVLKIASAERPSPILLIVIDAAGAAAVVITLVRGGPLGVDAHRFGEVPCLASILS